MRRHETFKLAVRVICPDRQVRRALARGGTIYDEVTGAPTRVLDHNTDSTERRLAELALAERNAPMPLAGPSALVDSVAYKSELERMIVSEDYATMHGLSEGTTATSRGQ